MNSIKEIMCPKDIQNLKRVPRMQAIYNAQYKIATQFEPETICEIGVRAGYSAHAFLMGSPKAKSYHGIDCDDQKHYGGPWLWYARELLDKIYKERGILWYLLEKDTQQLEEGHFPYKVQRFLSIGYAKMDLIHIDGDHSYEGCLHDMNIFWPCVADTGIMVVDDATYLPGPRKACSEFMKNAQDVADMYLEPSPTGSAVYVKKADSSSEKNPPYFKRLGDI